MTSSGETSPVSLTPAGTPSLTHAPKFGTVIANRIFVGGIPANTLEQELKDFFSKYGAVKDTKIIADRAGVSKGYGFVTFETQEDADKIIKKEGENLIFKERKLNIGPAIRKQAFPRIYDPALSAGTVLFTNGVPYTFQNGTAFFHAAQEASAYTGLPAQQPTYPTMVVPPSQAAVQPMYVSQPFSPAAAPAAQWPAAQWRWAPAQSAVPVSAAGYMYPMQPLASPEVVYAQPAAQGHYQPTDIADASLMEAAPAEGSMLDTEPMLHTAHRCADKVGTYRGCCTPRKMTASPIVTLTPCATPPTSQHDSHIHQPRMSHKPMNGTIVSLRAFNTDSDVSMEMDPLTPPGTPADMGF